MSSNNPLKGLSINDLLDLPYDVVGSLNHRELSRVVSRMSAVANKRLKRLEKAGFKRGSESGNINEGVISGTKKFVAKDKGLNQLRNEYSRVRRFLEGTTSTVTGMRKVREDFYERVAEVTGDDIKSVRDVFDVSDYTDDGEPLSGGQKFWRIVNNPITKNHFNQTGYSSSQIQGIIYSAMRDNPDMSIYDIINSLEDITTKAYEDLEAVEDVYRNADFTTL